MDRGGSDESCYYSILGIRKDASFSNIRTAFRKLTLIECLNVIILTATNVTELDGQWDCLIELTNSSGLLALAEPFVSKRLRTTQSDVETAQPLSKLCLEFPDLYIGCYRESRTGPLVISFEGKDQSRVEAAAEALCKKFHPGAFYEIN